MQYQIDNVRSKVDFDITGELPKKNIDTGLGMERLAMILQGVENMYETDQVRPVIDKAAALSGREYTSAETAEDPHHTDDVRMRVVADHIRSALMLIADGVTPSNEGRGYVLRRLIRRAVRSMRLLGVEKACLPELLPASRDAMKGVYPIVETDFDRISRIAYAEEKAFLRTIASGTARLEDAVKESKAAGQPLSGADAFALHDTYGFPIDLTLEMAEEAGLKVDEPEFRKLMLEQRQRAQADAKGKKGVARRPQRLPGAAGRRRDRLHRLHRARRASPRSAASSPAAGRSPRPPRAMKSNWSWPRRRSTPRPAARPPTPG